MMLINEKADLRKLGSIALYNASLMVKSIKYLHSPPPFKNTNNSMQNIKLGQKVSTYNP